MSGYFTIGKTELPPDITLPPTDCVTIVCDPRPRSLRKFVEFLQEHPDVPIRKLVVDYCKDCKNIGEWEMLVDKDLVGDPPRATFKSVTSRTQVYLSPVLDRTGEVEFSHIDADTLDWPQREDWSTMCIFKDAFCSERKWKYPRINGKTDLQVLFEKLAPGIVHEIAYSAHLRTDLPMQDILAEMRKHATWRDPSVDYIQSFGFDLPYLHLVSDKRKIARHLLDILDHADVVTDLGIEEFKWIRATGQVVKEVSLVEYSRNWLMQQMREFHCASSQKTNKGIAEFVFARAGELFLQEDKLAFLRLNDYQGEEEALLNTKIKDILLPTDQEEEDEVEDPIYEMRRRLNEYYN